MIMGCWFPLEVRKSAAQWLFVGRGFPKKARFLRMPESASGHSVLVCVQFVDLLLKLLKLLPRFVELAFRRQSLIIG